MNARRVYVCPVHGEVAENEVKGVEIFDCKSKAVHFVLEHIPDIGGKCFREVKRVDTAGEIYASSLC